MALTYYKRQSGKRKTFRTITMIFISIILIFGISIFLYSCSVKHGLKKYNNEMKRNPETKIIEGCEEITLQPAKEDNPATDTACLLVHGFCGGRINFGDLGTRLAEEGFTVRMLRLPGHGTYPEEFAALPEEALINKVDEEYSCLKKEYKKVILIGFSMGGSLSTILAEKYNPDCLVLLAPYYDITYKWYYIFHPAKTNAVFSRFIDYYVKSESFAQVNDRSLIALAFTYRYIPSAAVKKLVNIGNQAADPAGLKKIECPVLFIHSKNDCAASYDASRKVFDQIPSENKQFVSLEKSNHIICIDYERDKVIDTILEFTGKYKSR